MLKIGDVAEALGTTIRTIRYYEEQALITPSRSGAGTRFYSLTQVNRLKAILRLANHGYPLTQIRKLAAARQQQPTGHRSQLAVGQQINNLLETVDHQIQQLTELSSLLNASKQVIQQCKGCRRKPTNSGCPDCPVKQQLEKIELLNLIWDESD